MKTAILIPTYSQPGLLQKCIKSIKQWTDGDYDILVIDNSPDGYAPGVVTAIPDHANVYIAKTEINEGWIGGINAGLSYFLVKKEYTHVMFLNDDTSVLDCDTQWLKRLHNGFSIDDTVGAVGPISNSVMGFQNVRVATNMQRIGTSALSGFCMLLKRETVEKVGLLDRNLIQIGGDDLDYSIRIRKEGFRMGICRDVFIFHEGEPSYRAAWGDYYNSHKMFRDHYAYLIRKHGLIAFTECINFSERN